MEYTIHIKEGVNGLYEFEADGIDLKEYPGCLELVINGTGRDIIPLSNVIFIAKNNIKPEKARSQTPAPKAQ